MASVGVVHGTVPIRCDRCGEVYPWPYQARPMPGPANELHMRLTHEPEDELALRLFARAHQGPLSTTV